MGRLRILAREYPELATLVLVASLGCGGDDAVSTSSESADGSRDVSMTLDSEMAVTDATAPDAATEEASPEDSARADAGEPDDFDGSDDASATCSFVAIPQYFLAQAPTADCIGKKDVSKSPLQSITICSAACHGGMGCPLSLDWHNATTTSSSFIVQVDLKATVDVAVTGVVDQSCSLTYVAKNVRCIATFATGPDASATGPHLQNVACERFTPDVSGCMLVASIIDAVAASLTSQIEHLVVAKIESTLGGLTCSDLPPRDGSPAD